MPDFIKKIIEEKKEYREQMARVKALPEDYKIVFEKLQEYMWSFASGDGFDMLKTQYDLIELFEAGAESGEGVLLLTGRDVAAFANDLISGNKQWLDRPRERLNKKINNKLGL